MPDTTMLGTISVIIVILAVLGLIFLRRLVVRFFYDVLQHPTGRIVLGTFMCIGGLIYGFSSSDTPYQNYQNKWPVGGAIAGGGLLLLLITLGIPYLSKRWEKDAAKAPPAGQTWPTAVSPPPAGVPYMSTPQPGAYQPMPGWPTPPPGVPYMPTPQPGGTQPLPGWSAPQQGGTWPAPYMPTPMATNTPTQSTQQPERSRPDHAG